MALSSYDDILAAIYAGKTEDKRGFRVSSAPEVAGVVHIASTAGSHPANEKITFPNVSTEERHLTWMAGFATVAGSFFLFDVLAEVTGVLLNSTGNKTVSTAALTRYTDGVGVEALLEVTTVSAAAAVVSVNSYTDPSDNTGQAGATVTFPATATNVNTGFFMPLATGDTGLKAISTINVATSGAGSCACTVRLIKRIGPELPLSVGGGLVTDTVLQLASFPRIYDGAQLMWGFRATGTGANTFHYALGTVYG